MPTKRNENTGKDNTTKDNIIKEKKSLKQLLESDKSVIDFIIGATGVIVLLAALICGGVFLQVQGSNKQITQLQELGNNLSSIATIGEGTLIAVSDARYMELETLRLETELATEEETETESEEESSEEKEIEIGVNFTSVEKDIKVRFTNKATNKLITGSVFEVTLTNQSSKNTLTLKDTDKDGVLYANNMAAGKYTAVIKDVDGYTFPKDGITVTVKDKIE